MNRDTCEHFISDEHQCERCEVEHRPRPDLLAEAIWLILNSEPAPDIYVDPQLRGSWKQRRENWLTLASRSANLDAQP